MTPEGSQADHGKQHSPEQGGYSHVFDVRSGDVFGWVGVAGDVAL